MIEEAYSFFNVSNTLSDVQLQMTASLVLDEFYFLTIADLRLCFFNAYKNKYGKLYNRLDGSIIIDWLNQYNEERAVEAQRISEKKSSENKNVKINPEAAEKFKELYESIKSLKKEAPEKIFYSSFDKYSTTLKAGDKRDIEAAIEEAFKLIPEGEYDKESFRIWRKNTINFRINKGELLSDILEGIKAGTI